MDNNWMIMILPISFLVGLGLGELIKKIVFEIKIYLIRKKYRD